MLVLDVGVVLQICIRPRSRSEFCYRCYGCHLAARAGQRKSNFERPLSAFSRPTSPLSELPLLAGFSSLQLHLKRKAVPMAASQNWSDGQRPKAVLGKLGKRTFRNVQNHRPGRLSALVRCIAGLGIVTTNTIRQLSLTLNEHPRRARRLRHHSRRHRERARPVGQAPECCSHP